MPSSRRWANSFNHARRQDSRGNHSRGQIGWSGHPRVNWQSAVDANFGVRAVSVGGGGWAPAQGLGELHIQSVGCGFFSWYPGGNTDRPVSIKVCASLCSLEKWVSDRTIANFFICAPIRGRCSQTWMPGTGVGRGENSPRISTGASGFMSKLSNCDRPPERNMKRTDFAEPP